MEGKKASDCFSSLCSTFCSHADILETNKSTTEYHSEEDFQVRKREVEGVVVCGYCNEPHSIKPGFLRQHTTKTHKAAAHIKQTEARQS